MKKILFVILMFVSTVVFATDNVVNVYNWAGYMPPKVLSLFTDETGIQVNYSTFEDNQSLYAKIKSDPNSDYDVIMPSSYIVERMWREGMLYEIDQSKLSNFYDLDPKLLNKSYDPDNEYSIPYLWGTTGIIINTSYYPADGIKVWKDLWKPQFFNKVAMLNDMRDTFSIGLKVLGYSINDTNPKHIKEAYLMLKNLWPNVKSLASNGSEQMYVNEDANIGVMQSGDANTIIKENYSFEYIYPQDGAFMWIDCMAIPKGAKNIENAYKFINFILRPEIAKMISEQIGFSTPNLAAVKLMSPEDQANRLLNPTDADLANSEVEGYINNKANRLYLKYWELLKMG
jgi:spermidine/putrescine transport system substrate-binding protein